jgi:DNA-binding NarL/FixJ family response regulator
MTTMSGMDAETTVVFADYPGPSHAALLILLIHLANTAVVADVSDPELVVETVLRKRPDVVVVDDRMLRDRRWAAADLDARLIVVGVDDDPGFLARARQLGAETWVPKDRADSVLPLVLNRPAPVTR